MEEKVEKHRVRLYPSDWRWSASIVGIDKYFSYLENIKYKDTSYEKADDYIEFDETDITVEDYLLFAEHHFSELMHHKVVEDLLERDNATEEQIKLVNEKLKANAVMKKNFGYHEDKKKNKVDKIIYDGKNRDEIKRVIEDNCLKDLIKETFKEGKLLYDNFCTKSKLLSKKGEICRIKGYYLDMGKKSKSAYYMRDKNTFVYQDSRYFDFIPFAFSKKREAFFINNNFTIEQLINSNKDDLLNNDRSSRSQLFFKINNSANFIDYDVEVIKKEQKKDYFETIFVRKNAIKIFEKIEETTVDIMSKSCNAKRSEKSQDTWINIERIVTESILNNLKLDGLIDRLLKAYNNHEFLISHLIRINQLIYEGGDEMTEKQKKAYAAAMQVKEVLQGKENKLRAYEQRLISGITLKDYDRVEQILLHLSSFTQVKMDFLIDIFEDFEKNKNLVYTFVNALGNKKKYNEKGERK